MTPADWLKRHVRGWLGIEAPVRDVEKLSDVAARLAAEVREDIRRFEDRESFQHDNALNRFNSALFVMLELERKVDALAKALGAQFGPGDENGATVYPAKEGKLFLRAQKTVQAELLLRHIRGIDAKAQCVLSEITEIRDGEQRRLRKAK